MKVMSWPEAFEPTRNDFGIFPSSERIRFSSKKILNYFPNLDYTRASRLSEYAPKKSEEYLNSRFNSPG
jgi:hypothetical protein